MNTERCSEEAWQPDQELVIWPWQLQDKGALLNDAPAGRRQGTGKCHNIRFLICCWLCARDAWIKTQISSPNRNNLIAPESASQTLWWWTKVTWILVFKSTFSLAAVAWVELGSQSKAKFRENCKHCTELSVDGQHNEAFCSVVRLLMTWLHLNKSL